MRNKLKLYLTVENNLIQFDSNFEKLSNNI